MSSFVQNKKSNFKIVEKQQVKTPQATNGFDVKKMCTKTSRQKMSKPIVKVDLEVSPTQTPQIMGNKVKDLTKTIPQRP